MNDKEQVLTSILQLSDDKYFQFNDDLKAELTDKVSEVLYPPEQADEVERSPYILILSSPRQIDLNKQDGVPLIYMESYNAYRNWLVNKKNNLNFYIKNKQTGELQSVNQHEPERRMPVFPASAKGDKPGVLEGAIATVAVDMKNIASEPSIEFTNGDWFFTGINYDYVSNSVLTKIVDEEGLQSAEHCALTVPDYVKSFTPPHPLEEDRVIIKKHASDKRALLRVGLQLTSAEHLLMTDNNEPVLPANLIVLQLDEKPTIMPMPVPVTTFNNNETPLYSAVFELDLSTVINVPFVGEEMLLYIEAGEKYVGPIVYKK